MFSLLIVLLLEIGFPVDYQIAHTGGGHGMVHCKFNFNATWNGTTADTNSSNALFLAVVCDKASATEIGTNVIFRYQNDTVYAQSSLE